MVDCGSAGWRDEGNQYHAPADTRPKGERGEYGTKASRKVGSDGPRDRAEARRFQCSERKKWRAHYLLFELLHGKTNEAMGRFSRPASTIDQEDARLKVCNNRTPAVDDGEYGSTPSINRNPQQFGGETCECRADRGALLRHQTGIGGRRGLERAGAMQRNDGAPQAKKKQGFSGGQVSERAGDFDGLDGLTRDVMRTRDWTAALRQWSGSSFAGANPRHAQRALSTFPASGWVSTGPETG